MVPVTAGGGMVGGGSSAGATRHTVEVATKITTDTTQSSKAVEELTKRTESLEKQASKAQQALSGRSGGVIGGAVPPAYAAPIGTADPTKPDGVTGLELVTKLAAWAAVARSVLGLGEAVASMGEHVGTARQHLSHFLDAIPLLGDAIGGVARTVYSLHDAIAYGSARGRLARSVIDTPIQIAEYRFRTQQDVSQRLAESRGLDAAGTVALHRQFRRPEAERELASQIDTSRDPDDRSQLVSQLAGMETRRVAERNVVAARSALAESNTNRAAAESDVREAFAERMGGGGLDSSTQRLRERFEAARKNPYEDFEFRSAMVANTAEIGRAEAELERSTRLIAEYKERSLTAAQREFEFEKAKTSELKSQADVLAAREQKARAAASQVGLMGVDDKARLLQAAEKYNAVGFKNLTVEERGVLSGFGPAGERLRKDAEDFSAQDPAFRRLQELFKIEDAKVIAEERIKVSAEFRVQVEMNEQQYVEAFRRVLDKVREMERDQEERMTRLMDAKFQLQGIQSAAPR